MRFEFCGGVVCPEWFLAQITVLSKITALKTRLVFAQLIEYFLLGEQNQKVSREQSEEIREKQSEKVRGMLGGAGLDEEEVKAVMATLAFILTNSVRVHVEDSILQKQLVDLGLPRQNAQSISKTYKTARDRLLSAQIFLRLSADHQLTASIHDFLVSDRLHTHHKFAQCFFKWKDREGIPRQTNFIATLDTIDQLLFNLQSALEIMQKHTKHT